MTTVLFVQVLAVGVVLLACGGSVVPILMWNPLIDLIRDSARSSDRQGFPLLDELASGYLDSLHS